MKGKLITVLALTLSLLAAGGLWASSGASDAMTTLRVKVELLTKLGIDAHSIDVDTNAAVVSLTGTVEKRETKELAAEIARTVKGVGSVDNHLRTEASVESGRTVDSA